jgi:hypothetical protein
MNQIAPLEVQYLDPAPGLNPQDLAELGGLLVASGLTTMEARALVAEVQQMAAQAALGLAPKLLEKIRKVQEARLQTVYTQIRLLPSQFGFVSRDRVLSIVSGATYQTPST